RMGEYMMNRLREIATRHPSIGDVRGRGLMVGVEFVRDRQTRERAPEIRDAVVTHAFENRLLLLGCGPNTIRVIPALNVEREIIDEAMVILEHAIGLAEEELLR
ncbi:MAG: aminotransferase class III-fold pyridoxal phosphate-dependent enzyme, partial [Anaerolineae bacterium]